MMFDVSPDWHPSSEASPSPPASGPAPRAVPALLSGVVAAVEDGVCLVEAAGAVLRARCATGCLVEPVPGDRVLAATLEDGAAFVLSVLERDAKAPTVLSAPGDLCLHSAAGKVEVIARDGVGIVSPADVTVVSAGLSVEAAEGTLAIGTLALIGQRLVTEVPAIKVIAETVDTVIERLSQKLKRSYRQVDELERMKAGQVRYQVEKTMFLSAEDALLTATDVVKVDGEHVHIG
jgi:hypothetical protein